MAETQESGGARRALVEAAKALLPERQPSTVSGRELATRAGVNYGLVHHYFGSKDAVFREALIELRDEFLATHGELDLPGLLIEPENPYLQAIGRSQIDYPDEVTTDGGFPIGDAVVATMRERVRDANPSWTDHEIAVEAKARAIAMLCLQLGYGLYQQMLLAMMRVDRSERAGVEDALARAYREISRPATRS